VAFGLVVVALPEKVQAVIGLLLTLEGWLEHLGPCAGDQPWLPSTGVIKLLGLAQGMQLEGLGADGAATVPARGR
jgi:hypothetical protein